MGQRTLRCACIDIGSNTTRVLVADVHDGRLSEVVSDRAFTRLGRELRRTGALPPDAIEAVAAVVAAHRALAETAGASCIRVVATAAIRGAANRDELTEAVGAHCGLDVAVLSSDDEARLAFSGATRTMEAAPDGPVAVVDVGGGSSEIAVGTLRDGVAWSWSAPVGSGVLAEEHLLSDPPSAGELRAAAAHAAAALGGVSPPEVVTAVAVGGSATSLARLVGPVLDQRSIHDALAALTAAPAEEVAVRHALDPVRVRLMPAGLLILAEAARAVGRPLAVGRGGLREGVCLELASAA